MILTAQAPKRHATPAADQSDIERYAVEVLHETSEINLYVYADWYRRDRNRAVAAGHWPKVGP